MITGSLRFQRLAQTLLEAGCAGALVWSMNTGLAWRLEAFEWMGLAGAVVLGLEVARAVRKWGQKGWIKNGRFILLAWGLSNVAVWTMGRWLSHPLTLGESGYLSSAALGLMAVLHLLSRVSAPPEGFLGESLRLMGLAGAAAVIFAPFFTSEILGGMDARWYGYVMADTLQQFRAGVFPVFVGQGEFMFNGAVHPIRTAPYHCYLGLFIDLITGRVLTPLAILHLTVIVTAAQAAVTMYLCLVALVPQRRWLAWVIALLYVSSPAMAAYIYTQEMYMTFTAFAYLPVLFYANVRVIRDQDRAGWWWLAVGLSLVWVCHAPVALWTTLFIAAVQGLRLLTRDFDVRSWSRAIAAGAIFAGLTGYYFHSMSELALGTASESKTVLVPLLGWALGVVALTRLMATGHWRWLFLAVSAWLVLERVHRGYAAWMVGAIGLGIVLTVASRFGVTGWRKWLPEACVLLLLTGGVLSVHWTAPPDPARVDMQALDFLLRQIPQIFKPVSAGAVNLTDLQLGYVGFGFLLVGVVMALIQRDWTLRLLLIGTLLIGALLVPVPGLTKFLYTMIPLPIYGVSSAGIWMRFLPALVVASLFVGFLALSSAPSWRFRRGWQIAMWAGLAIALGWNNYEATKFIRRGHAAVGSSDSTAAFYRQENAALYYAYNHLRHPTYLLHGIADYHLESRLLNVGDRSVRSDPLLDSRHDGTVVLTTKNNPHDARWVHMEPGFTIPARGRLLFRFEFLDKAYEGILLIQGPQFYRSYYLPEGGAHAKSFGVASSRPKIISVWNSLDQPQEVKLTFLRNALPTGDLEFGDFARVEPKFFQPEDLQIKMRGLIPYRADVSLETPAYLETPRVYIPGYRARINGRSVPVEVSPDYLAMIRLEPGPNAVELDYQGTWVSQLMLAVSVAAWLGLFVYAGRKLQQRLATPDATV